MCQWRVANRILFSSIYGVDSCCGAVERNLCTRHKFQGTNNVTGGCNVGLAGAYDRALYWCDQLSSRYNDSVRP